MDRPILFSTPMVQAILEGKKNQTRRVIKPQPIMHDFGPGGMSLAWVSPATIDGYNAVGVDRIKETAGYLKCPYGKPGDTLWVRETWQLLSSGFDGIPPEMNYIYKATDKLSDECTRWRPSIHMPREAARLFLTVKNVRVERLQDITEDDATAEGIDFLYENGYFKKEMYTSIEAFEKLWDSCYQWPKTWLANLWVWVVEFERQLT